MDALELAPASVRSWLPTGRGLDEDAFRQRHRRVTASLIVSAATAAVGALIAGASVPAGLAAGLAVLGVVVRARSGPARRARSTVAAAALVGVAAIAVHLTGTIEAHVLFFIAVPLIAFYEDWVPFASALGLVLLHHVLGAWWWPGTVFDHDAALTAPVRWSLIHVGLLALMTWATLAHWRQHEAARVRNAELLAALHEEMRRDPLTGCANRRALQERVPEEFARARRAGTRTAVLALDLDGFKPLNDTYGHTVGDTVLVEVADRLRGACRASDLVARTGGDEFLLLLPETDQVRARQVADRLLAEVARPYADAPDVPLGASIGIAVAQPNSVAEQVLSAADEAMYEAKHRGRGQAVVAGQDRPILVGGVHVVPADARAWAAYVQAIRTEIASRKADGAFPSASRAPDAVHRTLLSLLASIEQLPSGPVGRLPLPDRRSLEEFLFHHGAVQAWVDDLVEAGRLSVERSVAAQRFWTALNEAVEAASAGSDVAHQAADGGDPEEAGEAAEAVSSACGPPRLEGFAR